ncbi:TlpA disulfide reductase family protein [uncultured Bacteroides sp.]|uniref:TlpA disulfide reductase family protein n=1 Tax=uncultured Bacteroides sp. TaxID=162156 RepID=UPI002AAC2827|nr:TlpA disulfide reductase family protein [uncultured Bacteroides sp.]
MRKISIAITLMLCLFSCTNKNKRIVIKGDIDGLKNDMILVYGAEKDGDALDTIYAKNGEFIYKAPVDTFTQVTLLFKNMEECVVFADKGDKIKIKGDVSSLDLLEVSGGGNLNDEMNEFKESIADVSKSTSKLRNKLFTSYTLADQKKYNDLLQSPELIKATKEIKEKAAAFIHSHTSSLVSAYLLDKYFVQEENPDYKKIKELESIMSGSIKDSPFMQQIIKHINSAETLKEGKKAPYFYLPNPNKQYFSANNFKDKYLLINFWASWSAPSRQENSRINSIYKRFNKNHFAILGISLDTDKAKWKEAIKRDSLSGEQLCDFNSWSSTVIQQFGIESLPANILIDPRGAIVARNMEEKDLLKKLEELFIENKTAK